MDSNANAINWFEVSVNDIARAKKFYETVFNMKMQDMDMESMDMKMAMFPTDMMSGKLGGTLAQSPHHKPSMDGAKVYINANPDLADALSRVEAAGGKIMVPKMKIDDQSGYMAVFVDTEGNAVGMHSNK